MIRINAVIMANRSMLNYLFASSSNTLLRLTISPRTMSSDSSTIKRNTFSVCTLNILAPCYKRLSSEYDRESAYESLWQNRHLSIINLLQSLDINLICLQEFWFKNPLFAELYKSHLSSKYSFYTLQRTGLLDDGLAILVDFNHIKVVDTCELILNDLGHRIGLLLNLEFNGENILIINLHLTFPHYKFERRLRLKQIQKFLDLIDEYQRSKKLLHQCSIILCGDFNSPYHSDPVYQAVENQFKSSYKVIHKYEPNVTHLTHRKEQLSADYIFYKSNKFHPISSELIPRGCNHLIWHDHSGWLLSDHRAVLTVFKSNDNQKI